MESRAAVPPGLPRLNPTKSYWQDPPDAIADLRTTQDLPETADVVIIGSGVSGSSIAYHILQRRPNTSVVMLEARQAASGASGRNGGHTKGASYRTFVQNYHAVGEAEAIKIAHLEYDCMVAVHEFIKQHNIPCDARRLDTVDVFLDEASYRKGRYAVDLMQKLMGKGDPAADYVSWDAEQTATKFRVANAAASLSYPAGSLSAYKFTIGVLKLALAQGLNLQCNTAVESITRDEKSGQWVAHTARGTIRTEKLVLATNGYTAHLYPKLQGVVVPYRGIITAQRPGSKMPQTGLATTFSFVYTKGYEYMISRPAGSQHEGDIVIGGGMTMGPEHGLFEYGNTDDTVVDPDIRAFLQDSTHTYFGSNWGSDHAEGQVRRAWSGVMGYSADAYPFVGPVPGEPGLFMSLSFQGHGMVLCFLCAQAATQMIVGDDNDDEEGQRQLDAWFPRSYRVTEERMRKQFRGRTHAPNPADVAKLERAGD